MNLKRNFINHCKDHQYEINKDQLEIINHLKIYYSKNFTQSFFKKIFKRKNNRLGFYLVGDVGTIESRDHHLRLPKRESRDNIIACGCVRRGGQCDSWNA